MTTFSIEHDALSPHEWYLVEPSGPNIIEFSNSTPKNIYESLLKIYGRFWISNDATLKYRQPNGIDLPVKNIIVGPSLEGSHIFRVNGIVVPTIALEQLKVLLRCGEKCRFNAYSDLLHKLNCYCPVN